MVDFRRAVVIAITGSLGYAGATLAQSALATDPPGRVGRLAFIQGTVSYHDAQRTDWTPALVNTPLTTGDAIWTEPKAHGEVSIAGTRVRLDGATQLDMLALDDRQTRMQIDQGRVDIKTFTYDNQQPYELVTPRGVVSLQQQGDYYVEAGNTDDPTRLGVRQGAAQFQTPNGQVLAVRAGEVLEATGDGNAPQLHTINTAPPPMPTYWVERDRQVVYDQPPQYLSASVTGYEDLNYYGTWSNDPEYGQVWYARSVPDNWAPYSTGRWSYMQPYGWTWIDEQPWGFAPYHYGRWAQRNNRWFWVPPERQQQAVYAPALVAFMGGTELGLALGAQSRGPVGWFPLGPREVYVPPYTTNRDYYRRVNLAARIQDRILEDRWERAQRREAIAEQSWMNRRYATVVPADDFARSRPVERFAIRVAPDRLAAAPVAAVSVPPSPTASIRALQAAPATTAPTSGQPNAPASPQGQTSVQGRSSTSATVAAPQAAMLQAIKPEPEAQKAPGPQVVSRSTTTPTAPDHKAPLPQLAPRNASAPPPVQIQGERRPASTQPGPQQATAPANQPGTPIQPGAAPAPGQPPQANAPANRPAVPPLPGEQNRAQPGQPPQPGQANLPPVRDRNGQRPEPPRAGEAPKPGEPPKPPQAQTAPTQQQATPQAPRPGEPPKTGEPPKPPQVQTAPTQQQATPQAPRPGEPPKTGEPPKPPQVHTAPTQQQATPRPAEPPKPPQAQTAPAPSAPPPQRQATPAPQPPTPQHQAAPPPPQQHQATPPAPPPPQQQLQRQPSAPPPPSQAHAPAPPPQPAAPPPQRQAAPAPPPPPQHAPAPPPPPQQQQHAAPPPQQHAPPPQQQAAQPPKPPAPAPAPPPKPAPPGQQKPDEKK